MKLSKFDIGAEIISILTRGMYPDPKDALREYIQNGVDAHASNIDVKIRQNSIVVEDNGTGMNHDVLRNAIRLGISDKNPSKDVGFMGIGIYSAFHLCDTLTIFSKGSENIPNRLTMDFGSMRTFLSDQKDKRLSKEIESDDLIDLQTLLETYITLSENNSLKKEEFPFDGTRVEMEGLEMEFYKGLSEFKIVADYLRNVIPLHFDRDNFSFADEIEQKIIEICDEHKQKFELITLKLQINSISEVLFRPYKNEDFNRDKIIPQIPEFHPISRDGTFFGVAWGCLNSVRKKIDNKNLRGFILKKQGFSIGTRESMVKFFPRGNTFFDRYSGEIIIVNEKLIPNASRSELEYSPLRSQFYEALTEVADKYDDLANIFQEHSKAEEELAQTYAEIKQKTGAFNEYEENTETLVDNIVFIKKIVDKIQGRIDRRGFKPSSEDIAKSLLAEAVNLEKVYQERLKVLTENKKQKNTDKKAALQIAKKLSQIKVEQVANTSTYESLYQLLIDLEFKIDEDFKEVIYLIDERFLQKEASSRNEYYNILNTLKNDVLNL